MRPRTGFHTFTSTRARQLFPDPLGPMTPRPLPACSDRLTSWIATFSLPGGTTATPSTARLLTGGRSAIGAICEGSMASRSVRRFQLCRAPTKPRQLAIARSTGASARALRIEPAMMMPGVAIW